MAIIIKSPWEVTKMTNTGQLHTTIFDAIAPLIQPGANTHALDQAVLSMIQDVGGVAPQIGYKGSSVQPYPSATCMSLDEVVVHGIPSKKAVLREGQLLSVDFLFTHDGYTTDMARTFAVGEVSKQAQSLMDVAEQAFWVGLEQLNVGNRIGDVAFAVQEYVERQRGMWCVREMVGHGVGKHNHEDPSLPNYGHQGKGPLLRSGMTLAFEPMVSLFPGKMVILNDGWTASMEKGNLSAHFENTVLISEQGPRLLTGKARQTA